MSKLGRPTKNPREERLGFRVSEKESEMIQYCIKHLNVSKSDILRLGIQKIYKEIKNKNN